MTFEIKPAVRKGVPPLISFWGASSSGKTRTALLVARGLVGPNGKIGVIDTENRRAEMHAGAPNVGAWDHLDLQPPFTPSRYTEAFKSFEDAGGYGCIVVDSFSHAWEGEGGVLDMADEGRTKGGYELTGLKKWQAPKSEYKRMFNALMRAPFAVIFCMRAKEGVKQVGSGKEAKIESIGVQPIAGKGMVYEMTISALLGPDHCPVFPGPNEKIHCDPLIPALKFPDDLPNLFQPNQMLGVETGRLISAWVNGAAAYDFDQAKLEREARNVASMGVDKLRDYWIGLGGKRQTALLPIKSELTQLAEDSDREAREQDDGDSLTEGLPL